MDMPCQKHKCTHFLSSFYSVIIYGKTVNSHWTALSKAAVCQITLSTLVILIETKAGSFSLLLIPSNNSHFTQQGTKQICKHAFVWLQKEYKLMRLLLRLGNFRGFIEMNIHSELLREESKISHWKGAFIADTMVEIEDAVSCRDKI